MVKYNCNLCGLNFSKKSFLISHKKISCLNNYDLQSLECKLNIIPNFEHSKKIIKYIDLFCGMGSFHYSFQKLGFKCVMASDIYKPAKDNYMLNYNIEPLGDICDINPLDIEKYDILCAGFPCQPFSQAGHRKGFDDRRGTMFSQVLRFVKQNNPKILILENVQALLNHDKGRSFLKIKTDLEIEGYTVIFKILKCSDFGIPQMRKRLFIIGFKKIDVKNLDQFFDLSCFFKTSTLTTYLNKNFKKDIAYTLRCGGKNSPIDDRHNWDGYWVDSKEYRLTIEDGLKLQGFYDYNLIGKNSEKWKLLGNTIPTIFTEIIGKQLIKHTSLTTNM